MNPFFFFPEASATFTVVDPAHPSADLGVSVTATGSTVAAGSQAVFELQVNNYGPNSSLNAQLTDVVPANTTFVSFQQLSGPVFTCSNPNAGDTGTTTCSIASLDASAVSTFIATYQVNNGVSTGTTISNTANISSVATQTSPATFDPNNLDDSSTASETVAGSPCVLTCPSNITQPADSGQAGAVVTYSTPSSTGDCGQPVVDPETGNTIPVIACSPASGSFFGVGTTTVVCSGQTGGVCTFQVTVENPGGLSITLNGANPLTTECGGDFSDPGATAVNGSGQGVPVTITLPQGFNPDALAAGSYILTYTATEGTNSVSTTRTVNVTDSQAPHVTVQGPSSITFSCGQAFVDPGVSASDACDSLRSVTDPLRIPAVTTLVEIRTSFDIGPPPDFAEINEVYGPAPNNVVDTNTPGKYRITYTATDSGGRTGTATRIVIVVPGGGTAPPNITLAGDPQMTVECGSFTDPGATASVPCGGTVPVTTSGTVDAHTPGTYTITYTACVIDTNTNLCDPARTASVDRTVTVQDTTAPTITVNGANPLQVECHGTFTDPGATAHDACAGDFAATASGAVNANVVGQYTITYNATDPSGNMATPVTRTVNVVDTTAPVVTAPPDVTVNTGAGATSCSATVSDATLGTGSANDACQGSVAVTRTGVPPGNVFPVGQTLVTYSATDAFNNTGSKTQKVTVVDNTPPTITLNGANPITVECHTSFTDPGATAHDNCSADFAATATSNVNINVPGTYTITYNATDGAGNQAMSISRTVIVQDTLSPTITLNGQTHSMWPPNHQYHTFPVTDFVSSASDLCDTSVNVNSVYITKVTSDEAENAPGSGNTLNDIVIAADCKSVQLRAEREGGGDGRVYTIYFKVKDASGNFATATAKVVVPHSQNGSGAVDSGPHYTVTSNCP